MSTKLTPEQLQKVETEMNLLVKQAHDQLEEWKTSLKKWIREIKGVPSFIWLNAQGDQACGWVNQVSLSIVTTNEMGIDGREINIIYDMPDELVAFLSTPQDHLVMPKELRDALKGSHIVAAKPAGLKA